MQVGGALGVALAFVWFDHLFTALEYPEDGLRCGVSRAQGANDATAGDWIDGERRIADREPWTGVPAAQALTDRGNHPGSPRETS